MSADFYCEQDVEIGEKRKCPKQCAMCRSLEDTARALVEDYVAPQSSQDIGTAQRPENKAAVATP